MRLTLHLTAGFAHNEQCLIISTAVEKKRKQGENRYLPKRHSFRHLLHYFVMFSNSSTVKPNFDDFYKMAPVLIHAISSYKSHTFQLYNLDLAQVQISLQLLTRAQPDVTDKVVR